MRSVLSSLTVCLLIAATLGVVAAAEAQERAGSPTKHVLVLYSSGRDAPMSTVGNRELPAMIENGLTHNLLFYSEYIDQGRFPEPAYQEAFKDFLKVKYAGQRMDLVVGIQDAAVSFLDTFRPQVFPDVPVVFLAISPPAQRMPNATGVITRIDLSSTITLARELQPDVRNVFVVSGAGVPDKRYENLARTQLRPFETDINVTYLPGLLTKDLETRLATLPRNSIVYYLVVYSDAAGELFSPMKYLERVASIANAPTYSWVDTAIGSGIVGGSLLDARAMMAVISNLAIRVLNGEQADGIPVASPNLYVSQVDWRQLRRWDISESRVPAGATVLFRQPSVFEEYKTYIFGTLSLVVLQAILIGGLLIQRGRRQRAEQALRESNAQIQDLAGRLITAQEAERSRIARELHDDVGQRIALLTMDLALLGRGGDLESKTLAKEVVSRAHDIGTSVHNLSHRLHPATLQLVGLLPALSALRNEQAYAGLAVDLTSDNVPAHIPPDVTLALFRIAQEALQNAIKHSQAHHVSVRLSGRSEGLALEIADDGIGFEVDTAWRKGLGLISMTERVEVIGGRLDIRSKPGSGTRLHISVPQAALLSSAPVLN